VTDSELLEAAAKAAGIKGARLDRDDGIWYLNGEYEGEPTYSCWNPLTDDGDALRLAVKLELHINIVDEGMCEVKCPERHLAAVFEHEHAGDTGAATRRAVVRAAAAIGAAK
jgi:hypothetical protein